MANFVKNLLRRHFSLNDFHNFEISAPHSQLLGTGLSTVLSNRQFLSSLKFSLQALVHLNCTLFHVNSLSRMCHKLYYLEKGFYLFLSLGAFHALDVFNFYRICCHTLLQVDVAETT